MPESEKSSPFEHPYGSDKATQDWMNADNESLALLRLPDLSMIVAGRAIHHADIK